MTNQSREIDCQILSVRKYWNLIHSHIALFQRGITGKALITVFDQAVVSASNLLTGIIIGRSCTKEQFGLYTLGFSILILIMGFQRSVISTPYTVYSPRLTASNQSLYTGSTLIHLLILSTIGIICLLVAGGIHTLGIGLKGLLPVMWALATTITFILFREYARQVSFAKLHIVTAFVLDSFVAVLQVGGLLLLAYMGVLSASLAYFVIGSACGLAALGWLISMRKDFEIRLAKVLSHLRQNWSFGKWLVAASLAFALGMQSYKWLLAGFHGTAATGLFAACQGVLFILNPLLYGVKNYLGPRMAHAFSGGGGARELLILVHRVTVLLGVVMGFFCLAVYFFGSWLVVFLYGAKYAGNDLLVFIVVLAGLASVLGMPVDSGLMAMERSDVTFKSYLIAVFVALTLGLWLVRSFGATGAALGLLTSSVASTAFRWKVFNKQVREITEP